MDIDVRALREEFGLTLDEMAAVFSCSHATISRWQTSTKKVDPGNLRLLVAFQTVKERGNDPVVVGTAIRLRLRSGGGLAALHELLRFVFDVENA